MKLLTCLQLFNWLESSLAFGSVKSLFRIIVCAFLRFLENDKTDLRQIFFRV